MLQHHHTAITNHALATADTREIIVSRFGEIVIDRRNTLFFTKGMLGMPHRQRFVLAEFPSERMRNFKLLQSLEEQTLAFIVLPIAIENSIVRADDLRHACRDMAMREEDALPLLIVCVHHEGAVSRLSVNARAPVLLDTRRKTGMQFVFPHDYYNVQHYIS